MSRPSVQAGPGDVARLAAVDTQATHQHTKLRAYLLRAHSALAKRVQQIAVVFRLLKPAESNEQQAVTASAVIHDGADPRQSRTLGVFGGRPTHGKSRLIEQRFVDTTLIQDCTDRLIVIQLGAHADAGQPSIQNSSQVNTSNSEIGRTMLAPPTTPAATLRAKKGGQA